MVLFRTNRPALVVGLSLWWLIAPAVSAQWTHRYPLVEGYRHHVYLEGFELPLLNAGPIDPAPSPDGSTLAFAARGWLWLLDLKSGEARRLTAGGSMDSRPAWSPNGAALAFVRDDTEDTDIFLLDLDTGRERPVVDSPALDLDPVFSANGRYLYYSSAAEGDLDVWRLRIATGVRERITQAAGIEVSPQPLPDGSGLIYLSKGPRVPDRIVELQLATGSESALKAQSIASQTRPAVSPDGRWLVFNWPGPSAYDLSLMDRRHPDPIRLTSGQGLPLTPAFSADGERVYFVEASDAGRFGLYRISASGGDPERVPIHSWNWGVETAELIVETRLLDQPAPVPARVFIVDAFGHPAVPEQGRPRFDSHNGRVYAYSSGVVTVTVPAGEVRVEAARGLSSPVASARVTVDPGQTRPVRLELRPVWDPSEEGWYSGDHHFHLNYGGPYQLVPEDLVPIGQAEDLDVLTPLLANSHHRFNDLEFWHWRRLREPPLIAFGQEDRSHFLGHLGLIGIASPFWPWFWGPGYMVYAEDDRPNADALHHARGQGGIGAYVHPVAVPRPFADENGLGAIPLLLIPDALLGDLDTLEIACLWTSELGTSETWYRLLNVGVPLAPSAGTDAFPDYFRSMAIGTTRVYAHVDGAFHYRSYLDALRRGRSFVTSGPLLSFRLGDGRPGDVVDAEPGAAISWELTVASALPVETIEVLVNGEVVWTGNGLPEPGTKSYRGTVSSPSGGWVAARAHDGPTIWPAMNTDLFAHTAPVWLNRKGSVAPAAARKAARDLLRALAVAEERLSAGYAEAAAPRIRGRLSEARRRLETIVETGDPR